MAKQLWAMPRHISSARGRSSARVAKLDPSDDKSEKEKVEAKRGNKQKRTTKTMAAEEKTHECKDNEGEGEEHREQDDEVTIINTKKFLYGHDAEHKQAWRMDPNYTFREFADKLVIPDNALDDDAPVAIFHDGVQAASPPCL